MTGGALATLVQMGNLAWRVSHVLLSLPPQPVAAGPAGGLGRDAWRVFASSWGQNV